MLSSLRGVQIAEDVARRLLQRNSSSIGRYLDSLQFFGRVSQFLGESPNFWESLPIFGRDALSHVLTCDIFQDINVPSLEYLAPVRSIIYYRRNYNTSSEIWENKKYFGRGFWDNWESGFGIIGRFQKKVVGSLR